MVRSTPPLPPYLFELSPDEWLITEQPAQPEPRRSPGRRPPRPRLFNLRGKNEEPRSPADRFRWRDGETLAEYIARTDDRRVRREDLPKDVRRVKGGGYQSRPWIGPGRAMNVNLGLFHPADFDNDRDAAISAAARAAREFKKRMAGPPVGDIWAVIQVLQKEKRFGLPIVPRHVLPPRVRRTAAGGFVVHGLEQSFGTVEEAWAAARAVL
jgi:hypothetical protein